MANVRKLCIAVGAMILAQWLSPALAAPLKRPPTMQASSATSDTARGETRTESDLVTDSFRGVVTDSDGKPATIHAYRTDDLSPSDIFSGTVTADGVDSARLEGVVYQIVQRTPSGGELVVAEALVSKGTFKGVLPTSTPGAGSLFGRILKNGQELARGENVALQYQLSKPNIAPTAGAVRIPQIQQSNRPVAVHCSGVCDGDLATTSFKMAGQEVPIRAESPRKAVSAPSTATGATNAEFKKKTPGQEVTASGECRQISVAITATSRTLRRGQHALLTVTFSGLEGMQETFTADLKNLNPQVVQLEGGNEQAFQMSPANASSKGTISRSWSLRGVQAGAFDLHANVLHQYAGPTSAMKQVSPPCENAIDMGIVASSTECPNGKVVFVDTHKWWCPPDGKTETSVVRTETDSPCMPAAGSHSTADSGSTGTNLLHGGTILASDAKGKGGDGFKDNYTRAFADPNLNICKQQNCGDPQEIKEGKDKGKIYCKKDDTCGGKQCPKASCHVFTAWIDGTKGPGGKDRKDAKELNEKWSQFGQDTQGIGDLTGIGKENAIPRKPELAYSCVCK